MRSLYNKNINSNLKNYAKHYHFSIPQAQLLGNAAEILPELVRRGVRPDAVTDQTSAHDLVHGYLPVGWTVEAGHLIVRIAAAPAA